MTSPLFTARMVRKQRDQLIAAIYGQATNRTYPDNDPVIENAIRLAMDQRQVIEKSGSLLRDIVRLTDRE